MNHEYIFSALKIFILHILRFVCICVSVCKCMCISVHVLICVYMFVCVCLSFFVISRTPPSRVPLIGGLPPITDPKIAQLMVPCLPLSALQGDGGGDQRYQYVYFKSCTVCVCRKAVSFAHRSLMEPMNADGSLLIRDTCCSDIDSSGFNYWLVVSWDRHKINI